MAAKKGAKKNKLTKPQQLWAEALRSGKYWHATEQLNPDPRYFCCLGVACVVAEKHGVKVEREGRNGLIVGHTLEEQPDVQEWLGLDSGKGDFWDGRTFQCFSQINDDAKRNPFRRIADIIEAQPEFLFVG